MFCSHSLNLVVLDHNLEINFYFDISQRDIIFASEAAPHIPFPNFCGAVKKYTLQSEQSVFLRLLQ